MEFVQEAITTLHDFGDTPPSVSHDRIAVVVPIMGSDVDSVDHVLAELETIAPGRVVLSVRAEASDIAELHTLLADTDLRIDVLWCNAPSIEDALTGAGVHGPRGKGSDVWLGMGVAGEESDIIVVHDVDTHEYSASNVSRLAWPIANGFSFSKAYYARIERDRFFGRLVRLLWFPLLDVLQREQHAPILTYLAAFRYPLAGEFAMRSGLVPDLRLHPRWGLEAGMLGEMFHRAGFEQTSQVDLGMHRHDHRPVAGATGLTCMARTVVGALADVLESEGITFHAPAVADAYAEQAIHYIDRYETDARFNGLEFDRANEKKQVASYRSAIAGTDERNDRLPRFGDVPINADEIIAAGQLPATHETNVGGVL